MKKIYFDSQYGLDKYALREDDELTEYLAEHSAEGAVIGNVYKGRVTDVLNGMQAAFIDCGLERHCYMSVADMVSERDKTEMGDIDIPSTLNLHEGDEIMVQLTKPAEGKKGAKVTTHISFAGKYIVYLPESSFIGVSAKISDPELRKNLMFSAKKTLGKNEGMIVRTAAPYAVISDKVSEINYYRKLYRNVKARFKTAKVGELLYSDSPLHMRVLRDLMLNPGDEIHVGTPELYKSVKEIVESFSGNNRVKIIAHDPHTDLFLTEGLHDSFTKAFSRKIELANGAYLIIEKTEALTVIDVNTGKFTGDDSLEHTVYSTNVLATREIARQVRLRNMGGIFVVDFIDMSEEKHRKEIVEQLEKALNCGDGKCKVSPMSQFGLVEFTRKRTGVSAAEVFRTECKACGGTGTIRSQESILGEFRARLLEILSDGASTVCADLNFDIANAALSDEPLKKNIASLYPQARVYVILHRTYKEDAMYFRKVDAPHFTLPEGTMLLY